MNEQDFASRIARRLDDATQDLPPDVLQRLKVARQNALAGMTSVRGSKALGRNFFRSHWRLAAPVLALLALAVGYLALHPFGDTAGQAIHELEAEMLNHELPPRAFHDEGFQEWLKRNPRP